MAYNYLGLVNDVNAALNEVELTENNFSDAGGYYRDAKVAVNTAIRDINQTGLAWPFNHTTETLILTPNVVRYSLPANLSSLMLNSFRIKYDGVNNFSTQWLFPLDYEKYLQAYSDMEYNPSEYAALPTNFFRTPDLGIGFVAPPDAAYEVEYEYIQIPVDLEDWDDVPTIPEVFQYVIKMGAMKYAYLFRGDVEASDRMAQEFQKGIKQMRTIYINRYEYVRSTQR